jgi:hypothetical protein
MNKKQTKPGEEAWRRTQPYIPLTWRLSGVQRRFIADLWQEEATPLPGQPEDPGINE